MRKLSMEELGRMSVENFKETDKNALVLVLDDIRSMNNVGSIFRTADAFKIEKIYLCGITGTPPNREITKTALGSEESVAWEYASDVVELTNILKANGYQIIAIEQAEGSVMLQDFGVDTDQKYAFVLGNEVFGVNDTVVNQCDVCLEIPQFGTKHSLNVAVSTGIVVWDFVNKTLQAQKP